MFLTRSWCNEGDASRAGSRRVPLAFRASARAFPHWKNEGSWDKFIRRNNQLQICLPKFFSRATLRYWFFRRRLRQMWRRFRGNASQIGGIAASRSQQWRRGKAVGSFAA